MSRLPLVMIIFLFSGFFCGILPGIVDLPDILPRETDVPGWIPGEFRREKGEALLRMAPALGEYDPLDMGARDYRRISGEVGELRVELFRFRSALDSFGACGLEGGPSSVTPAATGAGYRSGSSVFARRGPLYIRIRSAGIDDEELAGFAAVVLEKAKRAFPRDGLPGYLATLLGNSTEGVVYRRKGIDMIPGVKRVFLLRREIAGKTREVFFSPRPSDEDARRVFSDLLARENEGWHLSRAGRIQPAVRIIPGGPVLFLHHYKEWLYGVLNADTIDEGNVMILDLYHEARAMTGDRATD
ncbi:MAG: hypothetical protein JW838_09350 [Spirochaetes bacterium]|nr:hypothetical protein [Spirochaetota bacterium]